MPRIKIYPASMHVCSEDGYKRRGKKKGYSCCGYHLKEGSIIEFHEWDEVFNAEVTTLWLKGYICEFCGQIYYLAIRGGKHVL